MISIRLTFLAAILIVVVQSSCNAQFWVNEKAVDGTDRWIPDGLQTVQPKVNTDYDYLGYYDLKPTHQTMPLSSQQQQPTQTIKKVNPLRPVVVQSQIPSFSNFNHQIQRPQVQVQVHQQQLQKQIVPQSPFAIQKPGLNTAGLAIVETLVGGVPYNCAGKLTGHYRDNKYCDIFHACVYGQRKKSYRCPYVGAHTYYDERSKRCEFVNRAANSCPINTFSTFA